MAASPRRHVRGLACDRRDVTGCGWPTPTPQRSAPIFSSGGEKPSRSSYFVAEIGDVAAPDDQLYRLAYDGQVADGAGYAVMGGAADVVAGHLKEHYVAGSSLEDALRVAVAALGHSESDDRVIPVEDLEVATLERARSSRASSCGCARRGSPRSSASATPRSRRSTRFLGRRTR